MDAMQRIVEQMADMDRRIRTLEGVPFTDEVIDDRASLVAAVDRQAETTKVLTFTTGSPILTSTSTGFQNWLTLGTMTVPSWATRAYALCTISPLLYTPVGSDDMWTQLRVQIGSNTPTGSGDIFHVSGGSDVVAAAWGSEFTGLTGSGSQNVRVQSLDVTSDGNRWAATTATVAGLSVTFLD